MTPASLTSRTPCAALPPTSSTSTRADLTVNDITNTHAPSVPIRRPNKPNNPNVAPPLSKLYRGRLGNNTTHSEIRKKLESRWDLLDVIISLCDGLTVSFALIAGLSSRLVVLGGVAILITGAISMAAWVIRSCAGEMLGPVGVDEGTCRAVAKALRWSKDVGLTAFLLKFGQGLEVPTSRLYISAFTIGLGYLIGGLVPLFPYFFIPQASTVLIYSRVVMGVVLLVFGAIKAQVSDRYFYSTLLHLPVLVLVTGAYTSNSTLGVWKGIVWGAVSTLLVGGLAAGAALGIVKALEGGGE
ncbi:hypothetical protein D9758_011915 [Tetrapyrgos nigripes]|uniref:Uncharacterized protein n=1 Tax=Tetrapyrgos nigripes TaxID=182062 RepID=A0A8H5FQU3_9AGAR|nr:hypothetical protein D9758_011915 [Tetrapyrgos nigripes]